MKKYADGDCLLILGSYRDVLTDVYGKVNLAVTSPPYNIGSKGGVKLGDRKNGIYDGKSWRSVQDYPDSMSEDEYQAWQRGFVLWCFDSLLAENGVLAYNHKNRRKGSYRKRGIITPYEWLLPLVHSGRIVIREEIVWNRGSTHNHDKHYLYPETERIFVMHRAGEDAAFRNYDPSGRNKGIGDVWVIHPDGNNPHNCCFPLEVPTRCVSMWSKPGELVCDPFSGSGTTMMAALGEGRRFIGSELTKAAFDMAVKRAA